MGKRSISTADARKRFAKKEAERAPEKEDVVVDHLAKLRSYGLNKEDAEILGIVPLLPHMTRDLAPHFLPWPALRINYYGIDGSPLAARPSAGQFYRIRYLPPKTAPGAKSDHRRYDQPPDSGLCAYYPRNGQWAAWARDTSIPLIITEGEFKAAKACKSGFACLSVGGVTAFQTRDSADDFLPSLEILAWCGRKVRIVYDSDLRENDAVAHAVNMLAERLYDRGALPSVVFLPALGDKGKTGVDDFLISQGANAFRALLEERSIDLTPAKALTRLNEKYCYVADPGLVLRKSDMFRMPPRAFTEHAAIHENQYVASLDKGGRIERKKVALSRTWMQWRFRDTTPKLMYEPGLPVRTEYGYNTWPGWGCAPAKGDAKPFLALVDHLFGRETQARSWFLDWLAWPLQHPGEKMYTATVLYSRIQGVGKSFVGLIMGKIYGKNFAEVHQQALESAFNSWIAQKQFVLGDDITGRDNRVYADMVKNLITQDTVEINKKYLPTYTVRDCTNYLFTTNQPNAFFLEDTDRRFFVHEVTAKPLSQEFYTELECWMNADGPPALFDYLLHRNTAGFSPHAPALRTDAKVRMIEDGQSEHGLAIRQLRDNPDSLRALGRDTPYDLFTSEQLRCMVDPSGYRRLTSNGVTRECKRAGVPLAYGGRQIKTRMGNARYFIIRNQERWLNASYTELVTHIEQGLPPLTQRQKNKLRKKY